MANLVNDIKSVEKDLAGVVDEVFTKDSVTEALIGTGAVKITFLDARTIRIFKLATTGLYGYKRAGQGNSNAQGAVNSEKETFYLSQERWSDIPIDKLDALDDGGTVFGKASVTFIKTKVVPEFDCYRLSKWAGYTSTSIGNRKEGNISDNQIIKEFNDALEWFETQKVKTNNLIIYVSPKVMKLIRNTDELRKNLRDLNLENVSFDVQAYVSAPIVVCQPEIFYTDVVIGEGGFYPSATSKLINFLIITRDAPIISKKLDFAKIYSSDETRLGYAGYSITNLYYHDTFIPDNKILGVYASISNESAANYGAGLLINAVASTETGKTVIDRIYTQPTGGFYDQLYLCTTADAPAIGSSATSFTPISKGVPFAPDNTHNRIVAAAGGKVAYVSKDFENTLPKGQ